MKVEIEKAREQGRREALGEIAKMTRPDWHNPDDEPGIWTRCVFCHRQPINEKSDHAPDCLWLRACAATEPGQ